MHAAKKTEELLKDTTLSPNQRDRLIKQVLRVDTACILAITNMARSEGIVVCRAPFEFDPQGALLNRLGANCAVVSRDDDLLWCGAVIREVNRKDCTVVMHTAEHVWQAATTAGQAMHAPFNKLVSVLGITGAAVGAAMAASDCCASPCGRTTWASTQHRQHAARPARRTAAALGAPNGALRVGWWALRGSDRARLFHLVQCGSMKQLKGRGHPKPVPTPIQKK